jgi:predicted TIM-barrel fold metal-dependent hydrolase
MIFLNTNIISKTNGLYAQQAQKNLKELKAIMKNLIKNTPKDDTIWGSDKTATIKSSSSSQTQAGGNLWARTGL